MGACAPIRVYQLQHVDLVLYPCPAFPSQVWLFKAPYIHSSTKSNTASKKRENFGLFPHQTNPSPAFWSAAALPRIQWGRVIWSWTWTLGNWGQILPQSACGPWCLSLSSSCVRWEHCTPQPCEADQGQTIQRLCILKQIQVFSTVHRPGLSEACAFHASSAWGLDGLCWRKGYCWPGARRALRPPAPGMGQQCKKNYPFIGKGCPTSPSTLTGLMDARVVAELQDIEVATLDAAANAVQPGNIRACTLHVEQGLHQLFIAVVEEVHWGSHPHQEQDVPKEPEPLRHPPGDGQAALCTEKMHTAQALFLKGTKVQAGTSSLQFHSQVPAPCTCGGGGRRISLNAPHSSGRIYSSALLPCSALPPPFLEPDSLKASEYLESCAVFWAFIN